MIDLDRDRPFVVYKGKEVKLTPYLLFVHEGVEYLASGWDVDEDGDDVYLCYPTDGNKVLLGGEISVLPNEPILSDKLPWNEDRGWEYVEEDDFSEGADSAKDTLTFEEKLKAAREKIKAEAEAKESMKVDLSKTKAKEEALDSIKSLDARPKSEVAKEPESEELDAEIIHKKLAPIPQDVEHVEKDPLLDDIKMMDTRKMEYTEDVDFFDEILDEFDDTPTVPAPKDYSERLAKLETSRPTKPTALKGLDKLEKDSIDDKFSKLESERIKIAELKEKGFLEIEKTSSARIEAEKLKVEAEYLAKEKSRLEEDIVKRKRELADMEVLHKSPFRHTESYITPTAKDLFSYANPTTAIASRPGDLPFGDQLGFSKIAALQHITQNDIIENAELLLFLSKMTPAQKHALHTVANAIAKSAG